ncbi:MAG: hypothetical protein NC299_16615 [Lachnospiraceae bacterium]|nr:hypothetical protein [Ruminococcus sp.]MCM1276960.1 hypothetical protein [Lachnospiraceae bacterium]
MTIQTIEKTAHAAFEHFNGKLKTEYTPDNVKLAFYDNSDADAQYKKFCKPFRERRLDRKMFSVCLCCGASLRRFWVNGANILFASALDFIELP